MKSRLEFSSRLCTLDRTTRFMYNIMYHTISTSFMYDDYELDYSCLDYSFNLDEDYADTYAEDLDEMYTRDTHDYATLAYIHYA